MGCVGYFLEPSLSCRFCVGTCDSPPSHGTGLSALANLGVPFLLATVVQNRLPIVPGCQRAIACAVLRPVALEPDASAPRGARRAARRREHGHADRPTGPGVDAAVPRTLRYRRAHRANRILAFLKRTSDFPCDEQTGTKFRACPCVRARLGINPI